jgi:hypothetical protein
MRVGAVKGRGPFHRICGRGFFLEMAFLILAVLVIWRRSRIRHACIDARHWQ